MLHSCRSIAKSQITREIRNDAVERLSALVQSIPPEVELFSQRLALEGIVDAKDVSVDDLPSLSDEVLNLNLHEALNVVEQLKSAIENQRAGRMECINLLIMSRCKFGSLEAAEAFYGVDEKLKQIHETKLKLSDAMELEGIDVEDSDRNDERDNIDNIVALAPLEWYTNNENEDSGMTKRARIS